MIAGSGFTVLNEERRGARFFCWASTLERARENADRQSSSVSFFYHNTRGGCDIVRIYERVFFFFAIKSIGVMWSSRLAHTQGLALGRVMLMGAEDGVTARRKKMVATPARLSALSPH